MHGYCTCKKLNINESAKAKKKIRLVPMTLSDCLCKA